jgi:hypothetical protein
MTQMPAAAGRWGSMTNDMSAGLDVPEQGLAKAIAFTNQNACVDPRGARCRPVKPALVFKPCLVFKPYLVFKPGGGRPTVARVHWAGRWQMLQPSSADPCTSAQV